MFSEENESRLSAVNSQNGRGTPRPSCFDDKEHERTSVNAPRRYRAGSISRSRCAPQMLQCKSSSSSLAQEHERTSVNAPRRYRAGSISRSRCAPQMLQCKSSSTSLVQEHERTSVNAPRRYRAGSISRSRCAPQMLQCKSSSSSLAQLREKLTVLSPIVFNKVTAKIAVTPELSAVKEQDKYERLNKPIPRCGVVTYTKHYNSETRQREPAKTATIDLVAALRTSDQLVLDEARVQLFKKKPRVELSDCLAEQPKKHTQHKDTSLVQLREKLTALSPIVFNKVTAKIAVTPELSAVKEQDKYERLNKPIPRCGVVTYTKHYNSETRQREPVKTATIDLVAALRTSDQLVLDEARVQLFKKKPRVELSDCLAEQPKKHTQHKDTSLVQLREKLTVLSPIVFNKVTAKIAVTPELSAVKEQDKYERLNKPIPRCGVVTYTKHYNSETRQREPAKTATIDLVAALRTSDQLVLDEARVQLFKKKPRVELSDCLAEQPKKHTQHKDTSLVQLREKLTALSPIVFNKVTAKIAVTPELSAVKEQDKYERLNKPIPRCGVVTYTKHYNSETRQREPVKTATIDLVAALRTSDQLVLDEARVQLFKKKPRVELSDCLAEQPKKHTQHKDTSLVQLREKLTVLSPIVFNKVTAKIAVTPELSAVKEQDKYERLNKPIPRCGVVTYTKHYNSETRQREPAKTATIDLVAALRTSDQLVLDEARVQLFKKKPRVELSDCLAEQPKKHTQHKDTSLVQLREKLTALSPIVFNKVTAKIAVTPELSAVKEQDKYERLNKPIPRCGVVTYTKHYNSETRQREPVKTATIDLVAALRTSDQLVLDEARVQLFKKKPRVELSDCLAEQPKKHTQHKDTSLVQLREKLTALSPIVFNKVTAKIAVTPELSAVKEQDKYERLNKPIPRCGVVTYTKHYNSETRQREPVKTATIDLVAALRTSDQLVLDEARVQLFKKKPRVELSDCLAEQPKKHTQHKDTSLVQLRKKFTALSPIVFNKVTAKIAVTPELSAVKEQDEYERLNKPIPRCGVVTYTKHYNSETRQREPAKTATMDLVAALGTSDQLVLEEARQQLHKKKPRVELCDCLAEQPKKHTQHKDTSLAQLREKLTVPSSTVFNDVAVTLELSAVKEQDEYEPGLRPIPRCGVVTNRKHYNTEARQRGPNAENHSASSYLDASLGTSDQSVINKTNMKNYDETEALNNEAVDAYFFQQLPLNLNNLISPATIKGMCESLIEQEHIDDDCIIIDDIQIYARENNGIHLDIDANITDCVNHLSDKVCYNLDNGKDFLGEEQQEIYIKGVAKNNHYSSSDKNTPKSTKCNTESPINNEKQLICKKHRLYSPKDDDNENQYSLRFRKERRPPCSTESPIATCYKELGNARKSRVRLPRKRPSMQPIISPKTKEINDMFDKIKDNVVNNEKITLVDKESEQELYFYNMSSESDDEAFKKKKNQGQKRVSSSSLKSTSKHRRSMKPVNYTPYYSSEDECDRVLEPKAVKHTKRRNFNAKKIRKILADEIIRTQQPEVLETSFVQEKCDTHIPDEPEPALLMPVLEEVEPDDLIDQPIISDDKSLKQKKTKKSLKRNCEKLTKPTITSKSKEIVINVAIERENATVSPLPGLVVETEPPKDDLTPLDANVQTMNFSDVLSEKSIATCGDSPIIGHNNSNEFPTNLDAMCETFQQRDVGIEEKGRFLAEFLVNLRNQTINSKAAAINTSPMLDMIEKGFVTKSNPKPMSLLNLSPESGSDKSIPNVLLERLSSDDVESLLNLDAADLTRVKRPKTRPVKSVRSELITDSDKSRQELGNIEKGINSQETAIKSSKQAADENPSEISRSVACLESWIRNAAAEFSKTGTATETNATKMYEIVLETLDTQLVSINETHGDADQTKIRALIKRQRERACALIRADAEKKRNMVLLLKEMFKQYFE